MKHSGSKAIINLLVQLGCAKGSHSNKKSNGSQVEEQDEDGDDCENGVKNDHTVKSMDSTVRPLPLGMRTKTGTAIGSAVIGTSRRKLPTA